MQIRDIMTDDVEAVDLDAALDEAVYIMKSAGVGSLPVVSEEQLVGVITARDIVERAVAEGVDFTQTKVRDIMTIGAVSCDESADLAEAAELMERHKVRRLFIVDARGDLSGMLVAADFPALESRPAERAPADAPAGRPRNSGAIFGALALLLGGCLATAMSAGGDTARDADGRRVLAEAVVGNWWPVSALSARRLLAEYGVPDEVRPGRLVWRGKGPWKRTIVRDVPQSFGPQTDLPVVEQSLEKDLTPNQVRDLELFDPRLGFDPDRGELAAKSESEQINFLRFNLADDIVNRRMTPDEARAFHARAVALESAGKSSPYLQGLRASR